MSSCNRRAALATAALLALGACAFKPLHGSGNAASPELRGQVRVAEAVDPESFAFRERLLRRLGRATGDAPYALDYDLRYQEDRVAVTQAADTTRYQVTATARYLLADQTDGSPAQRGEIVARGVYDATAAPFATLSAQRDEREKLAIELAERVSTRLLATYSSKQP